MDKYLSSLDEEFAKIEEDRGAYERLADFGRVLMKCNPEFRFDMHSHQWILRAADIHASLSNKQSQFWEDAHARLEEDMKNQIADLRRILVTIIPIAEAGYLSPERKGIILEDKHNIDQAKDRLKKFDEFGCLNDDYNPYYFIL